MFSFFDSRTPAQRFADEAMEQISAVLKGLGRHSGEVQSAVAAAPEHLRTAARELDRLGIGPSVAAAAGQQALRHVSRNPSMLAPVLVVGAAVAFGYWLAQPKSEVAAPYVKRS